MWRYFAALAFAGALCSRAPASAGELIQVAQMSRDIADAVRKQREQRRQQSRRDHPKAESKR